MDAVDRQLRDIQEAEAKYKDDRQSLIAFWENLWANEGLKFNGVKWTYRLVDLYYKEKRYDDAWRVLNQFVMTKPDYLFNTRQWQIKILQREKKDTSHIQKLLGNGQ